MTRATISKLFLGLRSVGSEISAPYELVGVVKRRRGLGEIALEGLHCVQHLAHDAAAAGERITAEAYTQFADHYYRLHQAAIDAAEERKAQHAERQSRSGSPQPTIDEPAAENTADGSAADDGTSEASGNGAEVVDLTPAQLSEMVQDEQDTASA